MSPLADMLIDQHDSLDDALHHAMLMEKSQKGSTAAEWQFACAEIRAEINTTTYTGATTGMTASQLKAMAVNITQTEDAPPSPCWTTTSGWNTR